jgi:pseudouridine-5'-phosphate glycosidase
MKQAFMHGRKGFIMLKSYLNIKPEVSDALKAGKPVVALESTIISHGMPYPKNVETALEVENIVRRAGVVPATIAILDGVLKAGLTMDEIEYLGKAKNVIKTSRRDIPFIISNKLDGATTVASTMIIAALAGIRVFATGGIGGVHRGASATFDISADLQELAHTNVAVVCAGVKSILDIGLTLEYLETNGVPVVGYGTDEMPAFYTRKSGFGVDYRVDTPKALAEALKAKWELGLDGGMIVANPIPAEFEMDYDTITKAIDAAVAEAGKAGIKGKETTPYLLSKVKELTGGESLDSNIQLVFNNARVAGALAVELAKL